MGGCINLKNISGDQFGDIGQNVQWVLDVIQIVFSMK